MKEKTQRLDTKLRQKRVITGPQGATPQRNQLGTLWGTESSKKEKKNGGSTGINKKVPIFPAQKRHVKPHLGSEKKSEGFIGSKGKAPFTYNINAKKEPKYS